MYLNDNSFIPDVRFPQGTPSNHHLIQMTIPHFYTK